ncbi:nitric oxide reductase transcriptional regulator NorR [Lysobacter sp. S4-A87]|uniref:nitric oxide reductase transcriptional regulator NorR n=1 Tax=Lysobacter sp. S4-A87 TaxID=2925843 RepID=UPI001F53AF6C|nr:nitric oxide reductase transcriptional regulator NorR [Lysobacter sp. S4-A87]UNK50948.1 nitric oxide reductase transcriptional regulator NorR [Lysobacter sp. S4-A87]
MDPVVGIPDTYQGPCHASVSCRSTPWCHTRSNRQRPVAVQSTAMSVELTAADLLETVLPVVDDLSRDMPEHERYGRLLASVRRLFGSDASALLKLVGETLVPMAVDGLSEDTLGRRFHVSEHPRLAALLANPDPTRFPANSQLPDPYDGLVLGHDTRLHVHDCMGCTLTVAARPWGLLTIDALDAGRFSDQDVQLLRAFSSVASAAVSAAERMRQLAQDAERAQFNAESYRVAADDTTARSLLGRSPAFKRMQAELGAVGGSELTVLIKGETGVGKELVAKALHAASSRAGKPMISINCAALPESLVESELFGHVRGAFSGATGDRRGKFELADQGTLFLDEVGELPLSVQAKLLRVMQSGQLQRVGSDREHHVDVRIIAASNRDLAQEVRDGRFRADFYHRISVYPLQVPPLRERGHDILLISGYFLEENRRRLGLSALRLSADAQTALVAYPWPGNVRELEHLIARSSLRALASRPTRPRILSLEPGDLDLPGERRQIDEPPPEPVSQPPGESLRDTLAAVERRLIQEALDRHGNNWAAAARSLGLDRANLARSARRLGLRS